MSQANINAKIEGLLRSKYSEDELTTIRDHVYEESKGGSFEDVDEVRNFLFENCISTEGVNYWSQSIINSKKQLNLQAQSKVSGDNSLKLSAYDITNFMMDLKDINDAKPPEPLFTLRSVGRNSKEDLFMPRGQVCILASEGGIGKSLLCLHLGISLVMDQSTYLRREPNGAFEETESGGLGFALNPVPKHKKVVMLFAEENKATCEYRLKQLLPKDRDGKVDPKLLHDLSGRLIVVPLSSTSDEVNNNIFLSNSPKYDDAQSDINFNALKNSLNLIANDEGIDLIIIDPLAQFGGGDFERDNGEASALMRQFQRLTSVKGNPTVLIIHHSSKESSKNKGKLSHAVRGSSALTANSRWVAVLRRIGENDAGDDYLKDNQGRTVIELIICKSNYGACYQKVRYLTHQAEIFPIRSRELLSKNDLSEEPLVKTQDTTRSWHDKRGI